MRLPHQQRGAVAIVEGRIVTGLELVAKDRRLPSELAEMAARVGVEQQLVAIETVSAVGLIGPVNAITVDRAGPYIRQIAVPDLVSEFRQLDARLAALIEEAELDACRTGREQREIDSLAVPSGTQGMR